MEINEDPSEENKIKVKMFGFIMHMLFSGLINIILGVWLILTVKLNIVVIIWIVSIFLLLYLKYINFYSELRSLGHFGRTYFNYIDIHTFTNNIILIMMTAVIWNLLRTTVVVIKSTSPDNKKSTSQN